MLHRWNSVVENINLAIGKLKQLTKRVVPQIKGRGRKPKHDLSRYILLLVLKEFDKKTLRGAEVRLSELICTERVDHSVISYWENKRGMEQVVRQIITLAGALLQRVLLSLFSFVDATKFTSWKIQEVEVTLCNRIAQGTVYPVGISFQREKVALPVEESVPDGEGLLYADAGYDVNDAIGVLFKKGYIPIVCPSKNRWKGYWRKKSRKLYRMPEHRLGYRQRGRGESVFASLTNGYGDRFTAVNNQAMKTRIASRVLCYQLRLLLRVESSCLRLIVRHAQFFVKF